VKSAGKQRPTCIGEADVPPNRISDGRYRSQTDDSGAGRFQAKAPASRGSCLVRIKREEKNQTLAFSSRPFVLCGLPVLRPPTGELLFERRNGNFVLQITGHPEFGLPFGQDRLVPIYLATLAVQQKSQAVRFRSGAEMLATFGMQRGGKEYKHLVGAFERIFGATIFFGTDTMAGKAKMLQQSRFNLLQEAQIWYDPHLEQRPRSGEFGNVIVLSDEFYREITSHPIPTDLEAVRVLAGAPAALDLFMWLSYRCFVAAGQESILLFGERELANQLGSIEYSHPRRFCQKLEQWLEMIRVLWPDFPAQINRTGDALLVSRGSAIRSTERIGA
jgi:hypothetical protein